MKPKHRCHKLAYYLPHILLGTILLSGILCIFTFSIGINEYDLNDYIEGVLWADASLQSNSIINPDYVYYYIIPLGSNVIMAPFVRLFGVSIIANQLGMLVYYLIFLVVLFRLSKSIYNDRRSQLVFCSIVSLFIYTYLGDNLLHHLLVYGIGFVCFMGSLSCLINLSKNRSIIKNQILLVLFCLWSSSNGIACASLSGITVLAAFLYSRHRDQTLPNRDSIIPSFCMLIPIVVGLLIYRHYDTIATTLNMYENRFVLANTDTVITRLTHNVFVDYLKLFYFDPQNVNAFSPQGIYTFIKLGFAISIPIFFVCLYTNQKHYFHISELDERTQNMFLVANLLIILICISQYSFFQILSHRYLFNGLLSILLIDAFGFTNVIQQANKNTKLLPILGLSIVMTSRILFGFIPYGNEKMTELKNIYSVLIEESVCRGYISHRYYKSLDLLSHGELLSSPIAFDTDNNKYYVKYDRIYKDEVSQPDEDRFFVIKHTLHNENDPGDVLLEKHCLEKKQIGTVTIYFFNAEKWSDLFFVNTKLIDN